MRKTKKSLRLCPCNAYDVEGIQTWLEDMAMDGLLLEKEGYYGGVFTFLRNTPKKVTYRLDPVRQPQSSLFDENDPDKEVIEASEQLGWEYLVRYGMFHIYRTAAPNPRELHTDPAVHSMALNVLRKQLVSNIVITWIWVIIWLFLRQSFFGYPFRSAAAIGLIFTVSFLLWFLLGLLRPVAAVIHLLRYQKRLRAGDSLTARKVWRKGAAAALASKLLVILLPVVGLIGAALTLTEAQEQPLVPGTEAPFITIADLIPGGEYGQVDGSFGNYNEYRSWSTAAAPVSMEWDEWAYVTGPDGTHYGGILHVDYHEAQSEWLARMIADDYYQYDRNRHNKFYDMEAPEAAVDSIRLYSNYVPYILIRHGNIVIHATLTLQDDANDSIRDLWIEETVKWLNQSA